MPSRVVWVTFLLNLHRRNINFSISNKFTEGYFKGNVTGTQVWWPASISESQTPDTAAGAKGKRFCSVLGDLGEWQAPFSKTVSPSCSSAVLTGVARGGLFSYQIILLALAAWVLSIHLSSFWCTRHKNLPVCHLGQWGRHSRALTV